MPELFCAQQVEGNSMSNQSNRLYVQFTKREDGNWLIEFVCPNKLIREDLRDDEVREILKAESDKCSFVRDSEKRPGFSEIRLLAPGEYRPFEYANRLHESDAIIGRPGLSFIPMKRSEEGTYVPDQRHVWTLEPAEHNHTAVL
jgi:hypothetical protein